MAAFSKISCPNCNKTLKVPEELAGKTRACPYCRHSVKIPGGTSLSGLGFPQMTEAFSSKPGDSSPTGNAASSKSAPPSSHWLDHEGESATSDVSLFVSGIMAVVFTIVNYVILFPFRQYAISQIFWDRGWVPFATTFAFYWSVAILILKWRHLRLQKSAMLLDVLPTEISEEITIKSLDKFVDHIRSLPGSSSQSFLINRVLRGIEHFRVRKSAAETVTMMESQSAIDANNVAGSYSIIKVFIWSMPILGFIGTVLGLSQAVTSLAASLQSATDMSAMKGAMNAVFSGLGTAFDTTLLALILSMIVKIPTSGLQKSEEDLISSVDEYCNENLLRRLNDGRDGGAERGAGGSASVFRNAVEAAMGTHHAELEKWLARLDSVGSKMTSQMAESWEKVGIRLQQLQQQQATAIHEQQLEQAHALLEQQQQHAAAIQEQQGLSQQALHEHLQQIAETAGNIQLALSAVAEEAGVMHSSVNGTFTAAQETLQERFQGLQHGLNSLSDVLVKLGEQSIVVQQLPAPVPEVSNRIRKKGWFFR